MSAPDPKDLVDEQPDPEIFPDEGSAENYIDLPQGVELSISEVAEITRKQRTRVITVAGSPESGKTTLLTCLYDLLQSEPLAGYLFAGSSTLPSFEQRCHLSRIASGRDVAHTPRTVPGFDPRFLHLRLRRDDLTGPARDLVLADLSGENFLMAANNAEDCLSMSGMRRSDHFVLLIDGAKLVRLEERHGTVQEAFAVLRSFLDHGVLTTKPFVDVLLSKCDQLTAGDQTTTKGFVEQTWEETRRRFEARVGRLRCAEIACRPVSGSGLNFGHGISDLIRAWVEDSPFEQKTDLYPRPRLGSVTREMERFLFRASLPA